MIFQRLPIRMLGIGPESYKGDLLASFLSKFLPFSLINESVWGSEVHNCDYELGNSFV